MNPLCVIPSYWPAFQYGGPIVSVHSLNKALARKGIDINVYTTNITLVDSVPLNKEIDVDGVKVIYFTFSRLFDFLGKTGWQFSLPMKRELKNNLRAFDLVYIVGAWNYPTTIASYYCRQYKKPYIISPRGLLYPYATGKKIWKKWPYYHFITKRDLEGAVAIHYTTEDEAESCHAILGLKNRAIIIPNGIDLSEFSALPQEGLKRHYPYLKDKKVILFLGRINWKKGLDILIKVHNKISQERNDVHLLIVGDDEGSYARKVKGWVRTYHLDDRVTFTGMLIGKDKLEAYACADVFVLPSYSENFGMTVIEAMACGIPVVISNKVGLYREVQKNNAGVVIECNAISLYQGIKSILDNHRLRQEFSLRGREVVEKYYHIDKVADRMIEAYREILKGI